MAIVRRRKKKRCRVGTSTDSYERIRKWIVANGYAHGEALATGLTHKKVQERENPEAEARGGKADPGGRPVDGAVFSVTYCTLR